LARTIEHLIQIVGICDESQKKYPVPDIFLCLAEASIFQE